MIFMDIFDIANSLIELYIMNIQLIIYISSLGHYSSHQIDTEYYFCVTRNKVNENLIDFIFPEFVSKTKKPQYRMPIESQMIYNSIVYSEKGKTPY